MKKFGIKVFFILGLPDMHRLNISCVRHSCSYFIVLACGFIVLHSVLELVPMLQHYTYCQFVCIECMVYGLL